MMSAKEYYSTWKRIGKALNEDEDVMKKFFGIPENGYRPMLIDNITFDRIIIKYGDKGYAGISAKRNDIPVSKNIKKLLEEIKQSGYSYLPIYNGYEPSFLVFNYGKYGQHSKNGFERWKQVHSNEIDTFWKRLINAEGGIYVNPPHVTLNERMIRSGRNEIMIQ